MNFYTHLLQEPYDRLFIFLSTLGERFKVFVPKRYQEDFVNIQVNTDHNISGSDELQDYVEIHLSEILSRFKGAITRVEIYLSDENAGKSGRMGKRCLIEARVSHQHSIVVNHNENSIHQAIEKASDNLLQALIHMQGKLSERTNIREMHYEELVS